jgi:hypothetical protein
MLTLNWKMPIFLMFSQRGTMTLEEATEELKRSF